MCFLQETTIILRSMLIGLVTTADSLAFRVCFFTYRPWVVGVEEPTGAGVLDDTLRIRGTVFDPD